MLTAHQTSHYTHSEQLRGWLMVDYGEIWSNDKLFYRCRRNRNRSIPMT